MMVSCWPHSLRNAVWTQCFTGVLITFEDLSENLGSESKSEEYSDPHKKILSTHLDIIIVTAQCISYYTLLYSVITQLCDKYFKPRYDVTKIMDFRALTTKMIKKPLYLLKSDSLVPNWYRNSCVSGHVADWYRYRLWVVLWRINPRISTSATWIAFINRTRASVTAEYDVYGGLSWEI